jgi:hypothetical protein
MLLGLGTGLASPSVYGPPAEDKTRRDKTRQDKTTWYPRPLPKTFGNNPHQVLEASKCGVGGNSVQRLGQAPDPMPKKKKKNYLLQKYSKLSLFVVKQLSLVPNEISLETHFYKKSMLLFFIWGTYLRVSSHVKLLNHYSFLYSSDGVTLASEITITTNLRDAIVLL